jgi:hypothetical protein
MGNNMKKFKDYLNEKVIIPNKYDFKTTDVTTLNDWYNDDGFEFTEIDEDEELRAGYDPKTGIINVYVPENYDDLEMLNTLIEHEVIHKIQDKLSKGKMGERLLKSIDEINKLKQQKKREPEEKIDAIEKKIQKLQNDVRYKNQEELMTYSYMVTKLRKRYKMKNAKDVYEYLKKWLEIEDKRLLKKLKNYTKQYWKFKDKL